MQIDTELSSPPLRTITARQHAALVGLLAERNQLIKHGELYTVCGIAPLEVKNALNIDSGIMLIALTQRLGGDSVAAENALRNAIWSHMQACKVDITGKDLADINLEIPKIMLEKWRENPNDWLLETISAASIYLHSQMDDANHDVKVTVYGTIGGDVWRLYAGTLSVLGEPTSRHWLGDSDD